MKNYVFYLFNTETQQAQTWLIEGSVKASNPIEALKKWYNHLNLLSGSFKNFCYQVQEVEFMPNLSGLNLHKKLK